MVFHHKDLSAIPNKDIENPSKSVTSFNKNLEKDKNKPTALNNTPHLWEEY